jgi:hypothetical protein
MNDDELNRLKIALEALQSEVWTLKWKYRRLQIFGLLVIVFTWMMLVAGIMTSNAQSGQIHELEFRLIQLELKPGLHKAHK